VQVPRAQATAGMPEVEQRKEHLPDAQERPPHRDVSHGISFVTSAAAASMCARPFGYTAHWISQRYRAA